MAKIRKIFKSTTPFAGVFWVNDEFSRSGLGKLIDNQLGIRSSSCGYSYSNLFRNFFNLFFSGGECAEDLQQHFRPTLEQIPNNKVANVILLRETKSLRHDNAHSVRRLSPTTAPLLSHPNDLRTKLCDCACYRVCPDNSQPNGNKFASFLSANPSSYLP